MGPAPARHVIAFAQPTPAAPGRAASAAGLKDVVGTAASVGAAPQRPERVMRHRRRSAPTLRSDARSHRRGRASRRLSSVSAVGTTTIETQHLDGKDPDPRNSHRSSSSRTPAGDSSSIALIHVPWQVRPEPRSPAPVPDRPGRHYVGDTLPAAALPEVNSRHEAHGAPGTTNSTVVAQLESRTHDRE